MRSSLLLIAVALSLLGAKEEHSLFIQRLPLEVSDGVLIDDSHSLRIAVYARDPSQVARANRNPSRIADSGDHVLIDIDSEPLWEDAPLDRHRVASFIIDYEEPPVAALSQSMAATARTPPTVADLVRFVDQAIPKKTGTRGFDVASRVAQFREGDCTEHAVLLTALARAAGFPARMVLGVAILRDGDSIGAFGHAWSEIYYNAKWRRADATGIGDKFHVRYVRAGTLDEEGPGFALDLFRLLQIQRIAIVENVPREAGSAAELE